MRCHPTSSNAVHCKQNHLDARRGLCTHHHVLAPLALSSSHKVVDEEAIVAPVARIRSKALGVAPQSGRPHSGGLPDRAPGSLVKDPGSKRQDAHTQLVWAAKTSRNTTQRCEAQRLLASLGGFGTALLSRSDIPTCPLPSTLRGTLASGPKTGVNRGPHPPPGVCPRPNQNTPTKSPRRE